MPSLEEEIATRLKDIDYSLKLIEEEENKINKLIDDKIEQYLETKLKERIPSISVEKFIADETNKSFIESLKKSLFDKYTNFFAEKKKVLMTLRNEFMTYRMV